MQIKNLKKASNRILKAIKNNEKIIIYGDADLDGVSSVIILKETVKSLGGNIVDIYFPDREKEGHGLTETSLKYLKKYNPSLLITLDCGIGNFKEIKLANKIGFEVIIIDHHQVLDKLPEAKIIVDPKQEGEKYPFKDFANVGLTFKLAEVILGKKMTETLRENFLELTALGTIADMMPRKDENEKLIAEGLSTLESTWRPGIQALFELKEIISLNLMERVYKINSILNIRDVENRMPASFRLLNSIDKEEAKKLAKYLFQKNIEKREKVADIVEEVEKRISLKSGSIIFEGDSNWELILLGVVASILTKRYNKPVFLYKEQKLESQGAIRAGSGCDVVHAMKEYKGKLITFGGHAKAAGFKIKTKELDDFEEHLTKYFK
ncbi:MAG: DHH family phosphoesterase [Candidatus Nealsonbacteria bacterium]